MGGGVELAEISDNIEEVAKSLVSGKPWQRIFLICLRIVPLIISALLAVYSILSSSIFDDMQFVAVTADYILLYATTAFIILAAFTVSFNLVDYSKVIVRRPGFYRDLRTGKPFNSPAFGNVSNSARKVLRLTLKQIADTVFVILFPSGVVDLIFGTANNDLRIGTSGTGYIDEGACLIVISIFFLIYYIYTENKRVKKLKEKKARQIEAIINRHLSNFEKGRLDMNEYIIDLGDEEL